MTTNLRFAQGIMLRFEARAHSRNKVASESKVQIEELVG
jgi:hypothetical protein